MMMRKANPWIGRNRVYLRRLLQGGLFLALLLVLTPAGMAAKPAAPASFDLVVVGATPAGVCASVAAARMGRSVALVEETAHVGGMIANGLCHLDKVHFASVSGIIREWCDLNRDYYLKNFPEDRVVQLPSGGYDMVVRLGTKFEPHIAEKHFRELLAGTGRVGLFERAWPVQALKEGGQLASIVIETTQGTRQTLAGRQFIDATDEGDLAALAAVPFRLGREPRTPEEPHAGRIYTPAFVSVMGHHPVPPNMDQQAQWGTLLPGSDGAGDDKIQSFTFVVCLKNYAGTGSTKHLLRQPPPGYDPARYANTTPWSKLRNWPESSYALPNRKCQFHWAWFGSDTPEWSSQWPTASRTERARLRQLYRDYMMGYLYYLQHEARATDWGLADDEFTDNGNFPNWLYVREGRRIEGQIMLNESDLHAFMRGDGVRPPLRRDAIAIGDWPMDSHATSDIPGPDSPFMGEGTFFLDAVTPPFQVPYGVMVPRNCGRLLVPVACSATHVAFGALRVEQCRAAMGQAAGVAAALALGRSCDVDSLPVGALQDELVRQKCVLYYHKDLPTTHPVFVAVQQLSLRGAFRGDEKYCFKPEAPVTRGEAAQALVAALELPWSISAPHFRDCRGEHPAFRAVETLYDQGSIAGATVFMPDAKGHFRPEAPLGAELAGWFKIVGLPVPQQIPTPLTRAALAQMLWQALELKSISHS